MGFLEGSLLHPIFKPSVMRVESGEVAKVLKWMRLKFLTADDTAENPHGEILHFFLTGIKACWLPILVIAAIELDQDEHSRKT